MSKPVRVLVEDTPEGRADLLRELLAEPPKPRRQVLRLLRLLRWWR
ncbi:MAG: hypothetical protein ABJB98_01420 [Actinomycetota bacterium]